MTNNFKILVLFCVLILVPITGIKAESPIFIEADQMSSTEKTNTVLFSGDVDAKQGDLRIRSDKMTVYYTEQDEKKRKEKSRCHSTG